MPGCTGITDQITFYEIITTENTGKEVIRIANHMANTQLPAHCFLEKSNLSLNFVTLLDKTWQNYGSTKIRSFSPYGERIPSDPVDIIGKINRKIYFHASISKKSYPATIFF